MNPSKHNRLENYGNQCYEKSCGYHVFSFSREVSLTGKLDVNFRKFIYFRKVFLKSLVAKFYSLKNVFCLAISISSQIASPLGVSVKLFFCFEISLLYLKFQLVEKFRREFCSNECFSSFFFIALLVTFLKT